MFINFVPYVEISSGYKHNIQEPSFTGKTPIWDMKLKMGGIRRSKTKAAIN